MSESHHHSQAKVGHGGYSAEFRRQLVTALRFKRSTYPGIVLPGFVERPTCICGAKPRPDGTLPCDH